VTKEQACDGQYICSDRSDEKNCSCPSFYSFQCDCYATGCSGEWGCVTEQLLCNETNTCGDWSDEVGCRCPEHKFKCDCYETGCQRDGSPNFLGCIAQKLRCDGNNTCGDWSDEVGCIGTPLYCSSGQCIDRAKMNDGSVDLTTGDDEFVCNAKQTYGLVKCGCKIGRSLCRGSDVGRYIPVSWIGDAIRDCSSGSDEPCKSSRAWCYDCWVVVNRCATADAKHYLLQHSQHAHVTRCHAMHHTFGHIQSPESWICVSSPCGACLNMFQCNNGQVIDSDLFCDATTHCEDSSDEEKEAFGFRCSGSSRKTTCILPQRNVYDPVAQCADKSDLCFVNSELRCFRCLDGKLIVSPKQVCDGFIDCFDMSDECLCTNQTVCETVTGFQSSRCPRNQMMCNNETECIPINTALCKANKNCTSKVNHLFCHQNEHTATGMQCKARRQDEYHYVSATKCDGRPECWLMEDECDTCVPRPEFCDTSCAKTFREYKVGNLFCNGDVNDLPIESSCKMEVEQNCSMRFPCKSGSLVSIDKRFFCDGLVHCDNGIDEYNTDCLQQRFNCTNGKAVSVNKAFVCDGVIDCDDRTDESKTLCSAQRFYCESEIPISVDLKAVENGIDDCSDGSDECKTLFSDQYQMIAFPVLKGVMWIMGILALIGNAAVNITTTMEIMKKIRTIKKNRIKLANSILIWNLTISDFIMGAYLIAMLAHDLRYSGFYCFVDKQWRSSNLCGVLGTLVVLSSETSASIMAATSTFRLLTIYRPFLCTSVKIEWIAAVACSCWIFSASFAIFPWIPFSSGYFVSDAWFPNLFLKTDTVSTSDMFTLAERFSGKNSSVSSWPQAKKIVSDNFGKNAIKGEFGYYGATSVCIPRLFSSVEQSAWHYSAFLTTLNFALFTYMVIAYVLVYKTALAKDFSKSLRNDQSRGLQKRISRLLLTDFCCSIPVCAMGYLALAGVHIPSGCYVLSAGFFLPINSALNPLIYSKLFGRSVARVRTWVAKRQSAC